MNECCSSLRCACIFGHIDCVRKILERGEEVWMPDDSAPVAYHGHLELLKYIYENNLGWNEWTVFEAATKGHIECLKFALEHNCPYSSEELTAHIVYHGQLDILKYVIEERNIKWSSYTLILALRANHIDCFKYAVDQGAYFESHYIPYVYNELNIIIDDIDLDDWWWRNFFWYRPPVYYLFLQDYPRLYKTVMQAKSKYERSVENIKRELKLLPDDILQYVILPYL